MRVRACFAGVFLIVLLLLFVCCFGADLPAARRIEPPVSEADFHQEVPAVDIDDVGGPRSKRDADGYSRENSGFSPKTVFKGGGPPGSAEYGHNSSSGGAKDGPGPFSVPFLELFSRNGINRLAAIFLNGSTYVLSFPLKHPKEIVSAGIISAAGEVGYISYMALAFFWNALFRNPFVVMFSEHVLGKARTRASSTASGASYWNSYIFAALCSFDTYLWIYYGCIISSIAIYSQVGFCLYWIFVCPYENFTDVVTMTIFPGANSPVPPNAMSSKFPSYMPVPGPQPGKRSIFMSPVRYVLGK